MTERSCAGELHVLTSLQAQLEQEVLYLNTGRFQHMWRDPSAGRRKILTGHQSPRERLQMTSSHAVNTTLHTNTLICTDGLGTLGGSGV